MARRRTSSVANALSAYVVGGAVRDALLGLPVNDRDWVVVGATPQQMLDAGFRAVGKDFPVFLHPDSGEEYALARTERKTGPGYHGFAVHAAPDVTLQDDLVRRDLTINAMARDATGTLIDPHGGQQDLADQVLRHVSEAFAEDPVRILRLARFAARFHSFSVAPETLALMRRMVQAGEVDALVAERVWQELARGLMEARPSRMFEVLRECGALARLLPELDRLWGVPQRAEFHPEIDTGLHVMMVLDMAARMGSSLPVRFACLCHDLGKGATPPEDWPSHIAHEARSERMARALALRLKAPTDAAELAVLVAHEHTNIHRSADFGAAAIVRILERCDAFRRPQRFDQVLQACEADARGRLGFEDRSYPSGVCLRAAFIAATSIDAAQVAAQAQARGAHGPQIADAIRVARTDAVGRALD